MQVVLDLHGQTVTMEVDTGVAVSIMSEKMFRSWFLKGIKADSSCSQDLHVHT